VKRRAIAIVEKKLHHLAQDFLGEPLFFETPTIADAYLMGLVRWGDDLFAPAQFPKLARFAARMNEEPAVQFARAIEANSDSGSSGAFAGRVALEDVRLD
jgi:glutathione S-transferase